MRKAWLAHACYSARMNKVHFEKVQVGLNTQYAIVFLTQKQSFQKGIETWSYCLWTSFIFWENLLRIDKLLVNRNMRWTQYMEVIRMFSGNWKQRRLEKSWRQCIMPEKKCLVSNNKALLIFSPYFLLRLKNQFGQHSAKCVIKGSTVAQILQGV